MSAEYENIMQSGKELQCRPSHNKYYSKIEIINYEIRISL